MSKAIKSIDSKETAPLRGTIGGLIRNLETLSGDIYNGRGNIIPGLDIRQLPEYVNAVCAISELREAAARQYHKQNDIPL